jgi:hypothetical protein
MGIVGHHPESGVRVSLQRDRGEGPPWRYDGEAVTESARFSLTARLDTAGVVTVALPPDAPPGLAEKVRLMIRTAWKHAQRDQASDETAPPRRLVRWRANR